MAFARGAEFFEAASRTREPYVPSPRRKRGGNGYPEKPIRADFTTGALQAAPDSWGLRGASAAQASKRVSGLYTRRGAYEGNPLGLSPEEARTLIQKCGSTREARYCDQARRVLERVDLKAYPPLSPEEKERAGYRTLDPRRARVSDCAEYDADTCRADWRKCNYSETRRSRGGPACSTNPGRGPFSRPRASSRGYSYSPEDASPRWGGSPQYASPRAAGRAASRGPTGMGGPARAPSRMTPAAFGAAVAASPSDAEMIAREALQARAAASGRVPMATAIRPMTGKPSNARANSRMATGLD